MMWYLQPDGRLVAASHAELLHSDLLANLEDAAALCLQARELIAQARRICGLTQLIHRERQLTRH